MNEKTKQKRNADKHTNQKVIQNGKIENRDKDSEIGKYKI